MDIRVKIFFKTFKENEFFTYEKEYCFIDDILEKYCIFDYNYQKQSSHTVNKIKELILIDKNDIKATEYSNVYIDNDKDEIRLILVFYTSYSYYRKFKIDKILE
jgi:hypothetical protein